MPEFIKPCVRIVETVANAVGPFAMHLVFVMLAVLLYSSAAKAVAIPPAWTLEMAQFVMTAYHMLGGAYSPQQSVHVRMDVACAHWSPPNAKVVEIPKKYRDTMRKAGPPYR